jgi:hypothetical protein
MRWGNEELRQIDITRPDAVQIEWDQGRKVLYVHTDGYTALRMCQVENISFQGVMQIPLPNDESIDEMVNLAQKAFWAVIAALNPDITTGDFTPWQQGQFDKACIEAVMWAANP